MQVIETLPGICRTITCIAGKTDNRSLLSPSGILWFSIQVCYHDT